MNPLILDAAARLSVPRRAPADSFVLHAPLELMARVGLLDYAYDDGRAAILGAIATLVERYEASGPAAEPLAAEPFDDPAVAAAALDGRLRDGDVEGADRAISWLADHSSHDTIRQLVGESIVDSLAAAGHASIALHLLPRVAGGALPAALLRGPVRELARPPAWRLTWFRRSTRVPSTGARWQHTSFADQIRAVPMLGRPGSDFIFPLMSQAERSGAAEAAVGPVLTGPIDLVTVRTVLQRAAVLSMLHDDASQAPYGWSHALTMTQGVLSLAGDGVEVRTAVAVAATFLVGFRAAHGTVVLGSLDDASQTATRAGWDERSVAELAGHAGAHHDAHLVKYTLACLHAAEADPAWHGRYLAAAAHLADWWRNADSENAAVAAG